ncbi:MAG: hypothetical protein SF069_03070 [Phycisphaerae bacterium]|nr:hypothetical protein [Phycisphaerae bacterium]
MSRKAKPTEAAPKPLLDSIRDSWRDVRDQETKVSQCLADLRVAKDELKRRKRLHEHILSEDLPLFEEPSKPPQKSE